MVVSRSRVSNTKPRTVYLPSSTREESSEEDDEHVERIKDFEQQCIYERDLRVSLFYEAILVGELKKEDEGAEELEDIEKEDASTVATDIGVGVVRRLARPTHPLAEQVAKGGKGMYGRGISGVVGYVDGESASAEGLEQEHIIAGGYLGVEVREGLEPTQATHHKIGSAAHNGSSGLGRLHRHLLDGGIFGPLEPLNEGVAAVHAEREDQEVGCGSRFLRSGYDIVVAQQDIVCIGGADEFIECVFLTEVIVIDASSGHDDGHIVEEEIEVVEEAGIRLSDTRCVIDLPSGDEGSHRDAVVVVGTHDVGSAYSEHLLHGFDAVALLMDEAVDTQRVEGYA